MPHETRSTLLRFVGYTIPALLVFYVLSIGPAVAYIKTPAGTVDNVSSDIVDRLIAFYTPLFWVLSKNTLLRDFTQWYVDLWCLLF